MEKQKVPEEKKQVSSQGEAYKTRPSGSMPETKPISMQIHTLVTEIGIDELPPVEEGWKMYEERGWGRDEMHSIEQLKKMIGFEIENSQKVVGSPYPPGTLVVRVNSSTLDEHKLDELKKRLAVYTYVAEEKGYEIVDKWKVFKCGKEGKVYHEALTKVRKRD